MNIGVTIAAGALAASIVGGAWGYHLHIDAKKLDAQAAQVTHEALQLQLAQSSVQIQVVAKESRLRDIEAALDRLAVTEASRPLSAVETKRKRQLEAQYTAIVNELEKMQ